MLGSFYIAQTKPSGSKTQHWFSKGGESMCLLKKKMKHSAFMLRNVMWVSALL
jgi:hypothetical protein